MATLESAATAAVLRNLAGRAWGWLGRLAVNPVLVRDARSMFRGRRVVLLQLLYLALLMVVMGIASWALFEERRVSGGRTSIPDFGQWIFVGLFETQVALLLLIVVSYSAGAISLEREKQTYEALAITSLTSAEVVLGKIASITALCYLLMFTSAPLAAFSLFFGGVSPGDMAVAYGLLALKIPLWAGLGVLSSILARRSIGAHVLALIAVGAENVVSVLLTYPWGNTSPGLFSPFLAPAISDLGYDFHLFNWAIPGWLLPIPYAVLLTALLIVGAAEAMPHYRPQRSPLLRSLLLAVAFFIFFMMTAIMSASPHGGPASVSLVGIMALVWMWAVAFIAVFTSYPTKLESGAAPFGWWAVGPARWLERDARSGGGFCLLLWGASLGGALLAAELGALSFHSHQASPQWPGAPELLIALAIYALSIIAYSAWGAMLALVHRARRETALATALVILAVNSVAVIYAMGVHVMRRVPSSPALVLMSPAAAASTLLSHGRPSDWSRYAPEQALVYGLGYSLVLLCGAYWYFRAKTRRWVSDHDR
jgi:hypothetical protein